MLHVSAWSCQKEFIILNKIIDLNSPDPDLKNKSSAYLKYSSLGFQLVAVMVISVLLGGYLDRKWNEGNPRYWTVGLIVVLTSAYLYKLIRELTKKNNQS
jgi:ATP synthase protein I